MNKEKTLWVLQGTIQSLKEDLEECQKNKDLYGEFYYRGRSEGLEQLLEVIEKGYFD